MLKTQLCNWTVSHRKQPQQSSSAVLVFLIRWWLEFYHAQKVNSLFLMLDQSYCLLYLRIDSATQQGPAHTTAIKCTVSSVEVTTPPVSSLFPPLFVWQLTLSLKRLFPLWNFNRVPGRVPGHKMMEIFPHITWKFYFLDFSVVFSSN